MTILFVSDLHLDPERPPVTELFLKFLREEARSAEALYILGDCFEAWIGDDDPDPHHARVMAGMRDLTQSGVPVHFMHGNRDFLVGEAFSQKTGCLLRPDPTRLTLNGTPTLLMHGDTLCTDDLEYQVFRKTVRDLAWQQAFLAQSLDARRAYAREARIESVMQTRAKPADIMDVNQSAVEAVMHQQQVTCLIHGHTHRPAVHRFQSGGKELTRIVLGDWYHEGSILRVSQTGFALGTLPLGGASAAHARLDS